MTVAAARPTRVALAPGFAMVAVLALVLALRAPLAVMVLGLIAFGALHNVLELRYVAGRFAHVLTGRLLWTVCGFITGVVACRLLAWREVEILLGYAVLAAGVCFAWSGWRRWAGLTGLAGLALVSWSWPAYHFVVLSHLHNVVPLFFLWEWSRGLPERFAFRSVQLGWVFGIPILLLAGVFDPWIGDGWSAVVSFAGTTTSLATPVTPPGLTIGLRFLVLFAFMQTMHYAVWVGFLPRVAPEATAAFEQRVPWLRGRRAWLLGLGAAAFLAALMFADYRQGRTVYQALASYHAYLEFPVLLALLSAQRWPTV